MIKYVRKRDGSLEKFDAGRIHNAIRKAFEAVDPRDVEHAVDITNKVVDRLEREFGEDKPPHVEQIQDIVEETIMKEGFTRVAKAYIIYREKHREVRELSYIIKDVEMVDNYINKEDWKVRENSNMSYSLQGLNNYISSKVAATYWLNKIYPAEIRNAHVSGDFHIHDLGVLGAYCVGWDLRDLLMVGFTGAPGKISSKPAKHFRVALGQIVNFFYTLQGEAAGAQAFSNFDTYLAPFIRYDGLSYNEVKQALQEFMFNMNVPTRVGFQTPFTNLTLDLTPPSFMREEPVIIGGELKEDTYGDFEEEMAMLNKAFAEVMMEGDASGRPFTFPIPTYNVTKDFPYDAEFMEPIWGMTAKYGIPYFANFVNSDMNPEDVRSMCCRLRLDTRELKKRGGGLFGANPLTGSIGVVTINLPRIGYLAKDDDEYFERLYYLMDLAKKSLQIKRKVIEKFTEKGLYPYSKFYLRTVKQAYGEYWKNHFSTIGLIGMNESALNFLGEDIATKDGKAFALKVMQYMRKVLADFQEETGDIFNLEATPAEGASYRLALLDKRQYPQIIVANEEHVKEEGAAPFYTNSSLLPVDYTDDIIGYLNHQNDLQKLYTGGTVVHVFLGEHMPHPKAVAKFVKHIAENYEIPYYTMTPSFSICPEHGYVFGEHTTCPKCGRPMEVYSRVVGYIRPVNQWNDGKQSEFSLRKKFDKKVGSF